MRRWAECLAGSDRPLIVTSGLALLAKGRAATEDDPPASCLRLLIRAPLRRPPPRWRSGACKTMVVRLPQVHDTVKQGLVSYAIQIARQKGVSAYIGDGRNRWAAAHRFDAAHLYRLALEKGKAGREVSRGRRRGCAAAGNRRSHWPRTECAGGLHSRQKKLRDISAGSRCSPDWTLRARARKRGKSWAWNPTGPGLHRRSREHALFPTLRQANLSKQSNGKSRSSNHDQ